MMESEQVTNWLRSMMAVMPRGGKTIAANNLEISPSALSKILSNPHRAFDKKTIKLMAWIEMSKSEKYDAEQFPVIEEFPLGPMVIERRKNPAGPDFYTWKKAVQ